MSRAWWAVMIAALVVGGCGGGSTGSSADGVPVVSTSPTPAPTSTTPAPTPTPTSAATNLLTFTGSQQFNTLDAILQYDRSAAGTLSALVTYPVENTLSVIFDAGTSANYYFFNSSNIPPHDRYPDFISVRFGAATRNGSFSVATASDSGATYTLRKLTPGNNAMLSLLYVSIGTAEGSLSRGTSVTTDYRVFGYGFPAETNAVPASGQGRYAGIAIGRAVSAAGSRVYTVSGTFTLDANFAASTYAGTVTLIGTDDRTGESVALGTYAVTPTANYPLNMIIAHIGSNASSFRAFLAGPTAEELAGSFFLVVPDPLTNGATLTVAGAVGAHR